MVKLQELVNALDKEFSIEEYGKDAAFSRFIPQVYDTVSYNWKASFKKEFTELFNGLMIRGSGIVKKVFLAVFPTDNVLKTFIQNAVQGDLLFMHHPLLMECGDPKGQWGKGFVPIKSTFIDQIKEKQLSVYTCHLPMDSHKTLGTNIAIAKQLHATVLNDGNIESKNEYILYATIAPTDTSTLITQLKNIFHIVSFYN